MKYLLLISVLVAGVFSQEYCAGAFVQSAGGFAVVDSPLPAGSLSSSSLCGAYSNNSCCREAASTTIEENTSGNTQFTNIFGTSGDPCHDAMMALYCGSSCITNNVRYLDAAYVDDSSNHLSLTFFVTSETVDAVWTACKCKNSFSGGTFESIYGAEANPGLAMVNALSENPLAPSPTVESPAFAIAIGVNTDPSSQYPAGAGQADVLEYFTAGECVAPSSDDSGAPQAVPVVAGAMAAVAALAMA